MTKLKILITLACTGLIILSAVYGFAEETGTSNKKKAPVKGDILPPVELAVPESEQVRKYLGIKKQEKFNLSQINSDYVLIEIFSMYCPHCQREAPLINKFYEKLSNEPELKDKIKFIGIGVGNSDYEVNFFKEKYKINFPLFSDPDFKHYENIGEVRTPFFIGIKITKDKKLSVFHTHKGGIESVDKFLDGILRESGLKKIP